MVLLDRASPIHYGTQVNTLIDLRWHLASATSSTTSSTRFLLHKLRHVLRWGHQVLFEAYFRVYLWSLMQETVTCSNIIIGWIPHALSALSPSASSIFLTLIHLTIAQASIVKLPIQILLMHSKLSMSLWSHFLHFLHRKMLLHGLARAPIVPFIHVWISVWTTQLLNINRVHISSIYWIINVLILKCDRATLFSATDQLARGRVAISVAPARTCVVWGASSCTGALRWIFVMLYPLVLLMD